ncbi:MAG: Crp/Fnr family transcriptional regulator [Bacteroidetes bacterium]|jgi:CRP/FNR family transcriptional regulator|nr:Crp/Fnr family transcriptional regulator [Bacteroidota bacterium]
MDNIATFLDQHFPELDQPLKQFIASVSVLKHIPAGTALVRSGQYVKNTMLIAKGLIKIYREGEDGGEFFMYHLEPGNACAVSMICAATAKESEILAKAVEDSTVIMIPIQHMEDMMKNYQSWYRFVVETYRYRFEELLSVLDDVAFKNMDQRLQNYLDRQFSEFNTRELKLTHQQIADDLNTSREVVTRLLKKLEQNGSIKIHRSHIEQIT